MGKMSLSVVLPVSDGARLVAEGLPRIAREIEIAEATVGPIELIVVDDASSDHSVVEIDACLKPFRNAQVIRLPWSCGTGTAVRAGVATASGDSIVLTEMRRRISAQYLAGIADALLNADVVVTAEGAQDRSVTLGSGLSRRLSQATYARLASKLTVSPFDGCGYSLAAVRGEVAQLLFSLLHSPGLSFDVEAHVVASSMGLRTMELQPAGSSEGDAWGEQRRALSGFGQMIGDLLRARRQLSRAVNAHGFATVHQLAHPAPASQPVVDLTSTPVQRLGGSREASTERRAAI